VTVKEVGDRQNPHWKEIDPQELANGPVIVGQFRDVKKEAIHFSHGG
jgi:hypothetical protein